MKTTAKKIANYISEKINLTPNSNWTIYAGSNGLTHTTGSMEYRDNDYKVVLNYFTMDQAPETKKEILNSVEYFLLKW